MSQIAFLGLGAMGSRMAANLLRAGYSLTVWNRSNEPTYPLLHQGAKVARSPKEAVAGADFAISMLRDDEASRHVWLDREGGALAGMKTGAIAIESSTLTPRWIKQFGETAAEKGIDLLEAPVSGSTPQAEMAQLIYLVGGKSTTLNQCDFLLREMGSSIQYVGELGNGALAKLCTNTMLGIQLTTLAELIGILQKCGADVSQVLSAVATTPVWSVVAGRLATSMQAGNFNPQFPISLIEKDFNYILNVVESDSFTPTIQAARDVFHEAEAKGLGNQNMTAIVKLFASV
ncbi:NAD(P)-dependent oxidoreductase [Leeia sp. TBRC 13508]|uniref:NAD(P)-dependent oxidoreductase n=1 Tax=Leeia speluncae TaxID=2884804 RepID=A0ABS8D2Z7_9NEIS|nr:NAD(P)-dependent oxidoreductase [Leeia speluncae]MCB6182368.1 NAD(P)-dependent oxidoreductase [Leeia speluncae]